MATTHRNKWLLTNNPCSVAIHEARLLWPDEPFQCIVSVGTGKYKGRSGPSTVEFSSLREKLLKVVASATDTEGKPCDWSVHRTRADSERTGGSKQGNGEQADRLARARIHALGASRPASSRFWRFAFVVEKLSTVVWSPCKQDF